MSRILFIDFTCDLTHNSIVDRPIGASEFMYYATLGKLSKELTDISFLCFNKGLGNTIIDTIEYKNVGEIDEFPFKEEDIVIIQRLFPNLDILLKITSKNIFLTQHDYDFNAIFTQFQTAENKMKLLPYVYSNKNIRFIFNSEFSKKYITDNLNQYQFSLETDRINVLPNFIFKEYFKKRKNIKKNKYQLVYASAWNKGIQHILRIFYFIVQRDPDFELVLMSPGYEYQNYAGLQSQLEKNSNITILGPTDKDKYCKIIQESACVFAPPFPETFGCVFTEAYYLGTPVIADYRSGAVVEIVGRENIANYDDLEYTYRKLLEIVKKKVELNPRFLFDINRWKQILNI